MAGVFQITGWDENNYQNGPDEQKKSLAKITQNYQGDFEGTSEVQYLMSYQSPAEAVFVGFEVFTGKIGQVSGSVTFQHTGTFKNGVASSEFTVVEGAGTGGLSQLTGCGRFESGEHGQAKYQFDV